MAFCMKLWLFDVSTLNSRMRVRSMGFARDAHLIGVQWIRTAQNNDELKGEHLNDSRLIPRGDGEKFDSENESNENVFHWSRISGDMDGWMNRTSSGLMRRKANRINHWLWAINYYHLHCNKWLVNVLVYGMRHAGHGNGIPDAPMPEAVCSFLPINNRFCHLLLHRTVLLLQPLPPLQSTLYVESNDVWRLLKYDSLCNLKSSKRINRFRGFFLFLSLYIYLVLARATHESTENERFNLFLCSPVLLLWSPKRKPVVDANAKKDNWNIQIHWNENSGKRIARNQWRPNKRFIYLFLTFQHLGARSDRLSAPPLFERTTVFSDIVDCAKHD